jgi:predicted nucleotidyltransferase component of viral defense system
LLNLPFIEGEYIYDVFELIKEKTNNENFQRFLKYFEDNYLNKNEIKNWNYNDNIENTTNNCCEPYNNKLNNYSNKKPTFFKLL